MEHDAKLSDSSGRAKRGRRFWIELDKSGNLDFIFALLLLCAVHHCVVFYWPNTWNRLTVFKFWALNQFKRDIAITPGFYKPLKKKAETSWNSPYCQRNWHFCVRLDMSNQEEPWKQVPKPWEAWNKKVVSLTKPPLLMESHLCQYRQLVVIKPNR